MGRSCFLTLLLVSVVFSLCFSQGFPRKDRFENGASFVQIEVNEEKGRMMTEFTMDYEEAGANTNPSNGYLFAPPPAYHNQP